MATSEEEVRRRAAERKAAIASLTPERPGALATVGRAIGSSMKRSGEETAANRADILSTRLEKENVRKLNLEESNAAFGAGVDRFREGLTSGREGRPIDVEALNPVPDVTENAARPPEATPETEVLSAGQLGPLPPGFVAPETAEPTVAPPRREPAPAPITVADGATSVVRATPRPDLFTEQGGFEKGLPDDAVEVIRGTQRTFQEFGPRGTSQGIPEFRGIPGRSFDESRRLAGAATPEAQADVTQRVALQGAASQRINAGANRLAALASGRVNAIDSDGNARMFTMNERGEFIPSALTPLITETINSDKPFSIETIEDPNSVSGKSSVIFDASTGARENITEAERQTAGLAIFYQLVRDGEEPEDAAQQAEEEAGGRPLPNVRSLLDQG